MQSYQYPSQYPAQYAPAVMSVPYGAPQYPGSYPAAVPSYAPVPGASRTVPPGSTEGTAPEDTPLSAALCALLGVPHGTLWGKAIEKTPPAASMSLKQFPDIEDADKVLCAKRGPVAKDLEAGKPVYWCSCGRSKGQPFCDGSHTGTKFKPLPYTAGVAEKKAFCLCKMTNTPPFCDGTHNTLAADVEGKFLKPTIIR